MTIGSASLQGCAARLTLTRAHVVAAIAVDAVIGQALRQVAAGQAIVLFADALAAARAAPAFFVRVFVVGDVAARAVGSAVLFRRRAGLARPEAPTVATYAVGTIAGRALRRRNARRSVRRCRLRRLTRAGAIALTAGAFIVRIGIDRDASARAVGPAAFFRRRTSLAAAHADVVAAISIDAIVGQTLRPRRTGYAVEVSAGILPVT